MSGVKIDKVHEGTAAYNCGIRTGDKVLEVANVKVTHALEIFSVLSKHEGKGCAEVKVLRDKSFALYDDFSPLTKLCRCKRQYSLGNMMTQCSPSQQAYRVIMSSGKSV